MTQGLVIVYLVFYFLASQFLIPSNGFREVFPFFHWSLFSGESTGTVFYTIEFQLADGRFCRLEDCPESFADLRRKRFFYLLRATAKKAEAGTLEEPQLDQLLSYLRRAEKHYTQWQILRLDINMLDYMNSGLIKKRTTVSLNPRFINE